MENEEQYTLTYEYGDIGVTMNIGQGLNIEEMIDQFENFLLATGYRLPEGQSIGLVEETATKSKVEGYIGGLFDDNGVSYPPFDGANAWSNSVAADWLNFDGGDAPVGIHNSGVRGGMDDDIIRLS